MANKAEQMEQPEQPEAPSSDRLGSGIGLKQGSQQAEEDFIAAATRQLQDLGDIEDEPRPKKKKQAEQESDDQESDLDDDTEDEEDSDEDEDEGDTDSDEEETSEEEPKVSIRLNGKKADINDILPHIKLTAKVDGEEIEVDGAEMIKGYQRLSDYSRQSNEVKKMKDELLPFSQMVAFAKHDPQFVGYVENYLKNGPYPELQSNPDLRVNDGQLSQMLDESSDQYDPQRANQILRSRADWQQKSADRQKVMEATQQEHMQNYAAWANQQIQTAQQMIDSLGEPPAKEGEPGEYGRKSGQVLDFLRKSGFNDAEISGHSLINATDARSAVLAYKASEYDRIMRESDAPRVTLGKKRKRLPPPRSQSPGQGTNQTTTRSTRDSYRKAVKDQTSDSWVTAIADRLKLNR